MNQENYLQDNSEEATVLREKIKNLLLSFEPANIDLAYQLIKGGGMHRDFVPILWALSVSKHSRQRERHKITKFMKQALPPDLLRVYEKSVLKFIDTYLYHYELWEDWADDCLETIGDLPELADIQADLALGFMIFMQIGGRYALKHRILPTHIILQTLWDKENNSLSLENFRLQTLPAELANFPALEELNLQGNKLQTVPENLDNIPLDHILIDDNLPASAMQGLERAYPNAMGGYYKGKGAQLAQRSQSLQRANNRTEAKNLGVQAIQFLEKVPRLLHDSIYWFNVGLASVNAGLYEKSIEANQYAIDQNPQYGSGVSFYNIACAYANLSNKEKMMEYLTLANQHSSYMDWFRESKEDNDFTSFWADEDFMSLKK
jgi:tetratricopeptide (TPR) repeat protein